MTRHAPVQRTVGVDLSAEPAGTAVATIEWADGAAVLTGLVTKADDEDILDAIEKADKAGIDCPLGWPEPFVRLVTEHRDGHITDRPAPTGIEWRRQLAYRTTDLVVQESTGRWPLSVAANLIGHTAMRCAWLLAELDRRGVDVERAGGGRVVEVYPAASLDQWGLAGGPYKRRTDGTALSDLVTRLREAAPWLDLGAYDAVCRRSDDAFDAVIAALSARAAARQLVTRPEGEQIEIARIEGWIAVPTGGLDELP